MKKNILVTLIALLLVLAVSCDAESIMGIGKKMSNMGNPIVEVDLPCVEETKEAITDICSSELDLTTQDPSVLQQQMATLVSNANDFVDSISEASANPDAEHAVKEALSKRAETVPDSMATIGGAISGALGSSDITDVINNLPEGIKDQVNDVIDVIEDIYTGDTTVGDVVSSQLLVASVIDIATGINELSGQAVITNPLDIATVLGAAVQTVSSNLTGFIENTSVADAIENLSTLLYINDSSIELSSLISLFI